MPTRNSPRIKRLKKWRVWGVVDRDGNLWSEFLHSTEAAGKDQRFANVVGIMKPYRIAIIECREVVSKRKKAKAKR